MLNSLQRGEIQHPPETDCMMPKEVLTSETVLWLLPSAPLALQRLLGRTWTAQSST